MTPIPPENIMTDTLRQLEEARREIERLTARMELLQRNMQNWADEYLRLHNASSRTIFRLREREDRLTDDLAHATAKRDEYAQQLAEDRAELHDRIAKLKERVTAQTLATQDAHELVEQEIRKSFQHHGIPLGDSGSPIWQRVSSAAHVLLLERDDARKAAREAAMELYCAIHPAETGTTLADTRAAYDRLTRRWPWAAPGRAEG